MRNLLWIVIAVVVIGGGYLLFSGKSIGELTGTAEDAGESMADEAGEATEAAEEAAEDAVETGTEAAEDMADTVEDAADEVMDAADEAADAAMEGADEAVEEVTDAAEGAMETDAATEDADAATDAETLLSVDGFDLDKVTEFIDGSDLDDLKKTALIEAIKSAADDPEKLAAALATAREALGL